MRSTDKKVEFNRVPLEFYVNELSSHVGALARDKVTVFVASDDHGTLPAFQNQYWKSFGTPFLNFFVYVTCILN